MGGVRAAARAAGWLCCGSLILAAPVQAAPAAPSRSLELLAADVRHGRCRTASRVFVVERAGRVRLVRDGVLQAAPFLDIQAIALTDDTERGLLSMAFAPDYATSGRLSWLSDIPKQEGAIGPRVPQLREPGHRRSRPLRVCC